MSVVLPTAHVHPTGSELALSVEWIRFLYGYNHWANQRILAQTAQLSNDDWLRPRSPLNESVRDTLVHTLSAQWVWLSRWQQREAHMIRDLTPFTTVDALRTRWDEVEGETQAFVAALDEHRLADVITYVNSRGERGAYPLWQLMAHQVNHATQHRSEVALALTEAGQSPGDRDMRVYFDLHPTT